MIWSNLTEETQTIILGRIEAGEDAGDIAHQYGLNPESLARKIRLLRERGEVTLAVKPPLVFENVFVENPTRTLVYADPHFGQEDVKALEAVLIVAEEFQPELIINLGDTLDADKVSRFQSEEDAVSLQVERDSWGEWVERLHDVCSPDKHFVLLGNHDLRYRKTCLTIPGLTDIEELSMKNILYCRELGLETPVDGLYINPSGDSLYPDAQQYMFHGGMARKYAGSSARAQSLKYSVINVAVGHAHRTALIVQRTDRGLVRGLEIGCLCRLDPSYDAFPDWSNSIATGVIDMGYSDLAHVLIDRGRFVFNGKVYQV